MLTVAIADRDFQGPFGTTNSFRYAEKLNEYYRYYSLAGYGVAFADGQLQVARNGHISPVERGNGSESTMISIVCRINLIIVRRHKMNRYPKIPMRPEDVPQQRVHLVASLPPCPPSFQGYYDYVNPMPDDLLLKLNLPQSRQMKRSPRNTEYLGSVEWAWCPWHSRFDKYYLNPRRSLWLLWIRWWDDFDSAYRWRFYGYGPKKGVDAKTAAIYLLYGCLEG